MNELEKIKEHENLIFIGEEYWWTKEDIGAYEYLKTSHKDEMVNIIPHLRGNKVAIQAGGHCGYVIKELEEHFETIYTFEPNHTMFLALCLNVTNKNVYKFQACLGREHKMVSMAKNEYCMASGADYVKGDGIIPMFKIDDFALSECDLIMLDTEGYELEALIGGKETIEKFKPLICIERCWGERTLGEGSEKLMNEFLKERNYSLVARAGESDFIYKYKG